MGCRDMATLELIRERVNELCLLSLTTPSLELLSLPEHVFVSPITADDAKRWKDALAKVPNVTNYAVCSQALQLNVPIYIDMMTPQSCYKFVCTLISSIGCRFGNLLHLRRKSSVRSDSCAKLSRRSGPVALRSNGAY